MKKYIKQIRDESIERLEKDAQRIREEIAKEKLEAKVNQPKDTNKLFLKRKKLAVILTILSEKKELENIKKIKIAK